LPPPPAPKPPPPLKAPAAPGGGSTIDDACWRRRSCSSRTARSKPSLAAAPYLATASASVAASMSKLIGNGPTEVSICASPMNSIGRLSSARPSVVIGVITRIVPTLRSVTISSRYSAEASISGSRGSGRSAMAVLLVQSGEGRNYACRNRRGAR